MYDSNMNFWEIRCIEVGQWVAESTAPGTTPLGPMDYRALIEAIEDQAHNMP